MKALNWDESRTKLLNQMSFSLSCAFHFFRQRAHSLRILECHLSLFLPLSRCHYLPRVGLSILGQTAVSLQSCLGPPVCSDSVSVISSSEQPVWSAKDSPGHWSRSGTLQQPWRCINRLRWWSWVSLTALEWLSDGHSDVRRPRRVSRINTHRCQGNCWG